MPNPQHSKIFILDFDGTITTTDTISVIAKSALSFHARAGRDLNAAWQGVVEAYGEDYAIFVKGYRPSKEERKTIDEEIAFQQALKVIEERSFARVGGSGLFEGISEEEWKGFGEEAVQNGSVDIRRGFLEFVQGLVHSGGRWGVLSVNFSRMFVSGVLGTIGEDLKEVTILANQPGLDGVIKGPTRTDGEKGEGLMMTSDAK